METQRRGIRSRRAKCGQSGIPPNNLGKLDKMDSLETLRSFRAFLRAILAVKEILSFFPFFLPVGEDDSPNPHKTSLRA